MSLKKLVEEITQPIVEDMGGIVAGDGTINGSPSKKKVKKNKTNKMSGYKKVTEKVQSTVTSKSLRKKMDSKEWTVISHDQHWKTKKSKFLVRHNKSNKRFWVKLKEGKEIKKVIGVFGGRFQPFHSGHLATYNWLKKQVDEVYITTSNIKQPPRHPMNFKEKVRHMVKMGIPKNRIVQEKTPYVAANLLKKFDSDTTAVVSGSNFFNRLSAT